MMVPKLKELTVIGFLGMNLNDSISWQNHGEKMHNKASQKEWKITNIVSSEIVKVYISLLRPGVE